VIRAALGQAGAVIRLLPIVSLLLLGGCRCDEQRRATPPSSLQPPRVRLELGRRVSAADQAGQLLAAGTPEGEVLLMSRAPDGSGLVVLRDGEGQVHDGAVTRVQLDRDGGRLLSLGGHVAAVWDTRARKLLRRVSGPQLLTAGALLPGGDAVFFGTSQGHVLRWEVSSPQAAAVAHFACGGTRVPPARLRLPEKQRCTYGHYVETPEGPPACLYPVTQLLLLDDRHLARVCRTGEAAVMELGSRRLSFFSPGHLAALAPVPGPGRRLLLGRADGELRLFSLAERKVIRTLEPTGKPAAAAAGGALVAAVQGRTLRLWHPEEPRPVARVELPGPAIWLRLVPGEVDALLADGRLLTVSHQR